MKRKYVHFIIFAAVAAVVVAIDRVTKVLAVSSLRGEPSVVLIPGALELTYVENRGMAFGLLQGKQIFFLIATVIILGFVVFLLIRMPKAKKMLPLLVSMAAIGGGAVGNLIDRVFQRYVVDFIYVSLIDFPVFNVADSFVTIGAIVTAALLLFYYKDDDLKPFFAFRKKGKEPAE